VRGPQGEGEAAHHLRVETLMNFSVEQKKSCLTLLLLTLDTIEHIANLNPTPFSLLAVRNRIVQLYRITDAADLISQTLHGGTMRRKLAGEPPEPVVPHHPAEQTLHHRWEGR